MATDTKRIIELLDQAEVFYLSTTDGDQSKCRPISFKMERDGRVWFGVGTFKEVCRQLKANPKCEFCGMPAASSSATLAPRSSTRAPR